MLRRQVSKRGIALPAAKRSVTMSDVAREAGVSIATVSNAINNTRYVEAQTKARIDAVAAELGYFPNLHARQLRTGRVGSIGLFSSMPFAVSSRQARLGFLMEIAATAAISALESGVSLVLVPPSESVKEPLDHLAIDGALVVEPAANDLFVARLNERGIPVVTIGRQAGAKKAAPFVDLRSAETARTILDHLRASGARRIALMIGDAKRTSYLETDAEYQAFARLHKMAPVLVRVDESGGEEAACAATHALLAEHPKLDAIFALVDTFAAGVVRAAAERGVAIPARLRVATRYDGPRARQSDPGLTAVNLHLDRVAELAVVRLLGVLRGEPAQGAIEAPLPTLIARRSTHAS